MADSAVVDEAVVADLSQRLAAVQELLTQEMQVRSANEKLTRQIAEAAVLDTKRVQGELKELKALLEAEVDARCAVMQRLDQQVSDQHRTCEKFLQDSVAKLSIPIEAIEEKVQLQLNGYTQKLESVSLQADMFRDSVNDLAAEAKKHVKWMESQQARNSARQDSLENVFKEMKSNSDQQLDELENGLRDTQLKASSSSQKLVSFENELQELWFKVSNCRQELVKSESSHVQSKLTKVATSSHPSSHSDLLEVLGTVDEERHSEPAPRVALSWPYGENARHSEPTPEHAFHSASSARVQPDFTAYFAACSNRATPQRSQRVERDRFSAGSTLPQSSRRQQ